MLLLAPLARSLLQRQASTSSSVGAAAASFRRTFSAAAGLDDVDPETLRKEAAEALQDDELDAVTGGLDDSGQPSFPYIPLDSSPSPKIVRKNGVDLLHDPLYNKGTAFTMHERERLKLRGLLPPRVSPLASQTRRFLLEFDEGQDFIDPEQIASSGIDHESVRKWKALSELKDRNETLFYSVLLQNLEEMAPIVYTPTVAWTVVNNHRLFRRPRGFYFSAEDVGEMESMIWNSPAPEIDAIVITDGGRTLGVGDQGINSLAISIGKLDLYVAAAGFHPSRVLPIVVDVGTDNAELRNDPFYFGLRRRRIGGDDYFRIMDEVMSSLASRWPRAVIQFEDYSSSRASAVLERYRDHHLCFNDDIQGTAATALAGCYAALAVQRLPPGAIKEQRVVVVGAGSAGCGVSAMLSAAMVKHGLSQQEADARFWMLDREGLITEERAREPRSGVSPQAMQFARRKRSGGGGGKAVTTTEKSSAQLELDGARGLHDDRDGEKLLDVVRRVKPTVLIGLAGAGRIFTRDVLSAAAEGSERPIVFSMSNPLSKSECLASEAAAATGGRAIYASGSPQPDVTLANERGQVASIASSQANNVFVFPGLALGVSLGETGAVTDAMLIAAAEALPSLIHPADLARGAVYPRLSDARRVSRRVAAEVMIAAKEQGRLKSPAALAALERGGREELEAHVERRQYQPRYRSLIRLPSAVLD